MTLSASHGIFEKPMPYYLVQRKPFCLDCFLWLKRSGTIERATQVSAVPLLSQYFRILCVGKATVDLSVLIR